MGELSDAELDLALARGNAVRTEEPRASKARFDAKRGRVIVELTNGCTFAFPPQLAQGLQSATNEQLARIEILGAGFGLHWEDLDVDLSIPGLLGGIFGTRAHMARLAGRSTSPAKAEAARRNGAKGGRPRSLSRG